MAQPDTHVRFERSTGERFGLLRMPAAELPNLPLEDALQLVHLYAEKGWLKCEKAALQWLGRYLTESSPRLQHFTKRPAFNPAAPDTRGAEIRTRDL